MVPDLGHSMTQLSNGDILATTTDSKTLRRSRDGARTWEVIEGAHLPGSGPFGVLKTDFGFQRSRKSIIRGPVAVYNLWEHVAVSLS